jgi:hypothetical protein
MPGGDEYRRKDFLGTAEPNRPYRLAALALHPPIEKNSGASPEREDANPPLTNNHQERNFPGPQVHKGQSSSLGPTLRGFSRCRIA